jgi:alpha-galactosidase
MVKGRGWLVGWLVCWLVCWLAGCQPALDGGETVGSEQQGIVVGHTGIVMEMGDAMHFRIGPPQGETTVADGWAEVESDGEVVDQFALEADSVRQESVTTDLGQAQRFTASGMADLPGGGQLRRTITVDAYPQWPNALILQAHYENPSDAPITLDRVADTALQLDSSRTDPALQPNEFWSFQGASVEWGQDFAFPLPSFFSRDNYLGHLDGGEGGGIPLVYVWNRQLGVALAHIEPLPQLWYMPVRGGARHGVRVALEDRGPGVIPAGGAIEGVRTLLSVHYGDFYAPLALYTDILAAQGLRPAETNAEDYAPAWCSWGYEFDVQPEEVLGVIPKLQELGITWATLDDRWFDTYGDWNPRTETFPGREAQMRELVEAIHATGLYAQIWWYPLAVEDGVGGYESHDYRVADVVREHPDWLCRNADGGVARNNRGLAILDPAIPGVQEYIVEMTHRFIEDWGFDGHKLDNIYLVPACYGSPYHERPEDSLAAFAEVHRLIYETTRALKSHSVTQICPCGTPVTFSLLPYHDQAVTTDPTSSLQDFASAIGTGGVPGTKFVWPEDETLRPRLMEWQGLNAEKEALWGQWFALYNQYRLSEGEYLNLYDIAYDEPEGHIIRKDDRLYYAFYTPEADDHFDSTIELRGLQGRAYRLTDYVNGRNLGIVEGPTATLGVAFEGSLLIEAAPE